MLNKPIKGFKMKVAIIDIKRNTPKYDLFLTDALMQESEMDFTLFIPSPDNGYFHCRTYSLPQFFKGPANNISNIVKGLNVITNYFLLIWILLRGRYDVVHFQWLALLEKTSIESFFLKIISKKSKIVFTVHNIYPHSIDIDRGSKAAICYKNNFLKIDKYISHYIVHTEKSKEDLASEYSIDKKRISVCNHGIFTPEKITKTEERNDTRLKICMFGSQNVYKGTDLLVSAVSRLTESNRDKISVTIAGLSSDYRDSECYLVAKKIGVVWIDKLLSEEELDSLIRNSDILVFPYRTISQSGALLLALSYCKPIIASDLPQFKETLDGFPDEAFFKSEDVDSLKSLLIKYIDGRVDYTPQLNAIKILLERYSWNNSAKHTFLAYKRAVGSN